MMESALRRRTQPDHALLQGGGATQPHGLFCAVVLALCWLSTFSAGLAAEGLQLEYLGVANYPPNNPDKEQSFYFTSGALTPVPDCLGRQDPSPDDGYPGCWLARGHDHTRVFVGVFEQIPPGDPDRYPEVVVPQWPILDPEAMRQVHTAFDTNLVQLYGLAYQPSPCRIWWSFVPFYANTQEDAPIIGYSSCNPADPSPVTGFAFPFDADANGNNATHPNRLGWGIQFVERAVCEETLGIAGDCLILGDGKGTGTRFSSAGPAFGVAQLPEDGQPPFPLVKGLVGYPHPPGIGHNAGRYVRWYDERSFKGGFQSNCSRANGGQMVYDADGNYGFVVGYNEPLPNPPGVYPNTPEGAARYDNDPLTPHSTDPVYWYGIDKCNQVSADRQQPSFTDYKADGSDADIDCAMELVNPGGGTGPRCSNPGYSVMVYAGEDLRAVLEDRAEPFEPQPVEKLDASYVSSPGSPGVNFYGGAFDPRTRTAVLVTRTGGKSEMHLYRVGAAEPPIDCSVCPPECLKDPDCPEPEPCDSCCEECPEPEPCDPCPPCPPTGGDCPPLPPHDPALDGPGPWGDILWQWEQDYVWCVGSKNPSNLLQFYLDCVYRRPCDGVEIPYRIPMVLPPEQEPTP